MAVLHLAGAVGVSGSRVIRLLPLLLLVGCAAKPAIQETQAVVEAAADKAETVAAESAATVIGAIQDAAAVITEALPEPVQVPRETIHPDALALVVGFEVISPAYYQRALQGIICPPGASGPTGGIGYDFGHQSASTIRRDWAHRADVERLATASRVTGVSACRAWRAQHLDVRIPLAEAERVFSETSVPVWMRATRRAYPGIQDMSGQAEGGMFSNTFNRGTSFLGSRASEKREIRDRCIPARDAPCAAIQTRQSCRVWKGTDLENGLCRRRNAEGDLIEAT